MKKRLRQYPKYPTAVPSVAFNCDGTKLAVGVSYTWDEGEEGARTAERPRVYIRTTGDEVKVSCLPSIAVIWVRTHDDYSRRDGLGVRLAVEFPTARIPLYFDLELFRSTALVARNQTQ